MPTSARNPARDRAWDYVGGAEVQSPMAKYPCSNAYYDRMMGPYLIPMWIWDMRQSMHNATGKRERARRWHAADRSYML